MQKIKNYLTLNGWKKDLDETMTDFKDIKVLVRRGLGLSHYGYGDGREMTSRELDDFSWRQGALWFSDEQEFQNYMMKNKFPLGRCVIGFGKNERRYDDADFYTTKKT